MRFVHDGPKLPGEHPHVGQAPDSKSVEFNSHKRGNAEVVIGCLPFEEQEKAEEKKVQVAVVRAVKRVERFLTAFLILKRILYLNFTL